MSQGSLFDDPAVPDPERDYMAARSLEVDAAGARELGERGMEQALDADRVALWRREAQRWVELQPAGTCFTADDLVAAIGLPDEGVYKNNSVGGLFGGLSKAGLTRFTGHYRKSARKIGHGNLQRIWMRV